MQIEPLQRSFVSHTPQWQRFQTDRIEPSSSAARVASNADSSAVVHPYQRQYAHVYHQRLAMLAPLIWKGISSSSPDTARVDRILELQENVLSVAVGTLVKEQGSKGEPLVEGNTCREDDSLYLEDESGRVVLETEQLHEFTTGVCVGVEGIVGTDGLMRVQKFHFPEMTPPSSASTSATTNSVEDESCIMLVSGLDCGSPEVSSLPRDMLVTYLEGRLGHLASKVSRVILAGGLASKDPSALTELDGFVVQLVAAGLPST